MVPGVGNNVKLGMPLIILLFIFSSFITSRKAVPLLYLSINLVKIELLCGSSITTVSKQSRVHPKQKSEPQERFRTQPTAGE